MCGLIHSMLVITPFTVIVESGMNSAVSEWWAAAGSANTVRENASNAARDIVVIGFFLYTSTPGCRRRCEYRFTITGRATLIQFGRIFRCGVRFSRNCLPGEPGC